LIRLVAFDAAGTLIHLREPVGETYARMARSQGVTLPPWRLEDAFRRVLAAAPPMVFRGPDRNARERGWWRERVRACFRAADQTTRFPDFEGFFAALFDHYATPHAWEAAPGAAGALEALRAGGRKVAIASNFDHRLPGVLAGLGLGALDAVLLPGELGVAKPDPGFFEAVSERLGVGPKDALYVGNDPVDDLEPARRAGWRAIDVASLATLAELAARIERVEAGGRGSGGRKEPIG
jgi:putative hydrolase of the HAD superfamily